MPPLTRTPIRLAVMLAPWVALWLASSMAAQTPRVSFGPAVSTAVGNRDPRGLTVADMNRDGHADLIVTALNSSVLSNTVTILRGDGTGLLTNSGGVMVPDAAGVAAADFDRNGAPDLAVTEGVSTFGKSYGDPLCGILPGVVLFLGPALSSNGCLFAGSHPIGVQAADFDNDGRIDLAIVSREAQGLRIFRGRGDGFFDMVSNAGPSGTVPGSALNANRMALADMNGDGDEDLFVSHTAGVNLFLGSTGATFAAGTSAGSTSATAAAAAADFNRDGTPDVASVESTSTGRLLVRLGAGAGTFLASRVVSTIGAGLTDVAAGDIDSDGRQDIIVADNGLGVIRIFFGNGDGTFVAHPALAISIKPKFLAVRDWDEDGDLDLAIVDSSVGGQNALAWIALQGGSPTNTPPTPTIVSPATTDRFSVGQTITLQGVASDIEDGTLPAGSLTWSVLLHHGAHTHTVLAPTSGNALTFRGPSPENLAAAATSYLEVRLTARDSRGASATVTRQLLPRRVSVTVDSVPQGLSIRVNELSVRTPSKVTSWHNYALRLMALTQTDSTGTYWVFSRWSDGGAASHVITTPSVPATFAATFERGSRVTAAADAYVRGGTFGTTNFGSATTLLVKRWDPQYDRRTYLKFNISGRTINRAILRLRGRLSSAGAVKIAAYPVANTTWGESSITWNTRPALGSTALSQATVGSTTSAWYEWDVTQHVRAQATAGATFVSLALVGVVNTQPYAQFNSREASSSRPELIVTQ